MKIDTTIVNLPAKNSVLKPGHISNFGLLESIREYSGTANGNLWDGIWTDGYEGAISEFNLIQHHLYILADEHVHSDEWFMDADGIWKQVKSILVPIAKSARKIMTTTDHSLGIPLLTNQFTKEYFQRLQQKKSVAIQLEVEYWDEDCHSSMLHCDTVNERGYATLNFK